ncbi:MAG TPA: Ger(x)C family spore germination protein [Bacilli bacterium]
MLRNIGKLACMIAVIALVPGCWDNLEFNRGAMVMGAGLDRGEHGLLEVGVNIFTGSGQSSNQSQTGGAAGSQTNAYISTRADTLAAAIENITQSIKRQLVFTHAEVWLFGEKLARANFVPVVAALRREQMIRPRSYILITDTSPATVLKSTPIFKETVSSDIFGAVNDVRYSPAFIPVMIEDFFEQIDGPVQNAFLPVVSMHDEQGQQISEVSGTAVIKNNKMVGTLNADETFGLSWLLNRFRGGTISVQSPYGKSKISVELFAGKANIKPVLNHHALHVDIAIRAKASLSDFPDAEQLTEARIEELQDAVSSRIKQLVERSLSKLQKQYRADITDIGIKIYRRYPQQWHELKRDWDSIFAAATATVSVQTIISNAGMTNRSFH